MTIRENNKGNGYIIALTGGKKKQKEKIVLETISKCLREHPGNNIDVVFNDDEILISADRNKAIEEVKTTSKHSR